MKQILYICLKAGQFTLKFISKWKYVTNYVQLITESDTVLKWNIFPCFIWMFRHNLGVSLSYSKSLQKRGSGAKIWYFHALSTLPIRFGYTSSKTPYWSTWSKLDGGDWDEHWILCPSLVNCRQNAATCWPLYPTYARSKDDRQLIFHLH